MRKPGFGVVTFVLVVLCVIAGASKVLRPLIPDPKRDEAANLAKNFEQAGNGQRVVWRKFDEESLAEARRTGKPILLTIGTRTSRFARLFDEAVLDEESIAAYLTLHYVCIRVDAFENPPLANALLPLTRLQLGFLAPFQTWILAPDGRPMELFARGTTEHAFTPDLVLSTLVRVRGEVADVDPTKPFGATVLQQSDLAKIQSQPGGGTVPISDYSALLRRTLAEERDGFGTGGLHPLHPHASRFLLSTGDLYTARDVLRRTVLSPRIDLIDGGFFRIWRSNGWVEFDKVTVENAEMAATLALAGQMLHEPLFQDAAKRTVEMLAGPMREGPFLSAGQVGLDGPRQRSERYSFPPRRLREALTSEQVDWAEEFLGLQIAQNVQAVPFPTREDTLTLQGNGLEDVLFRLRALPSPERQLTNDALADVNLTTVARLLEVARIWNAQKMKKDTGLRLERMEAFRVGNDILRKAEAEQSELGSLGDYLAYADARLQDYVTNGRVPSLEVGLAVLNQARGMFRGETPGEFVLNRPEAPMLPDTEVPEIADNLHESATARMIRLCLGYGRLLSDRPEGLELLSDAYAATALFSNVALDGGALTAGYFCAADDAQESLYAICVGPKAQELADALHRRVPFRFVAAAHSPYRADLRARGPGIYISRSKMEGPFDLATATRILSRRRPGTVQGSR